VCGSVQRSGWRWIIVGHRDIFLPLFCILHSEWKTGVGRRGGEQHTITYLWCPQPRPFDKAASPAIGHRALADPGKSGEGTRHACLRLLCCCVGGKGDGVEVRRLAGGVLLMRK